MKQIQMVDLFGQYQNIQTEIDQAMQEVISSSAFIKGPFVETFEKSLATYLNINHVIGCANGTDALQLALMALDLKPGDEVISPNFTFISTVEVISLLGLKPVLVDVDPDSFIMDLNHIKRAYNEKTKAIIPVHLFGQCANMKEIIPWAQEKDLYVIEDAAQALGAECEFSGIRAKAGTLGTIGCTSFFPSKNLGCFGDGGALFTHDDELAQRIRLLSNHGMQQKYQYQDVGMNSRLDGLQAAILNVKLKYLDVYNEKRKAAAELYNKLFSNVDQLKTPVVVNHSNHIYHQYTIKLDNASVREALQSHLRSHGIPSMVYYPNPMHNQKAYKDLDQKDDAFPNTIDLCSRVISLPMHTELENNQIEFIAEKLTSFFK